MAASPVDPGAVRLDINEATTTGDNAVWTLDKYALEPEEKGKPRRVSLKTAMEQANAKKANGAAITVFSGADGYYTLTAEYYDRPNGRTTMQVRVDGTQVAQWYGDNLFSEIVARRAIPHVALKKGSKIEWIGNARGSDMAAIIALEMAPGTPAPPPPNLRIAPNDYSQNLVPIAERVETTDPRLMIPPLPCTWPDTAIEPDVSNAPVFYFHASKGQRFEARVTNMFKADSDIPWTVRKLAEGTPPAAGGTLKIPTKQTALVSFEVPEDGVYELRVSGTVTGQSHGLSRPLVPGMNNVHFFVPKDTSGIRIVSAPRVKTPTPFLLRDAAGTILFQGEVPPKSNVEIAASPDKTGQVWSIECSSKAGVLVEGVPPYCAMLPADLLAPAETLPVEKVVAKPLAVPDPVKPVAATAIMAGATPVTLVRDGQPACVIVARTPGEPARILQRVLQQVTGALIPIVKQMPADGTAIVVAAEKDFPDLPLPKGWSDLGNQGITIRTEANRLYLLGRAPRAMESAVYTFLHQIGCRWYFGDKNWEILPGSRDLTVAQDLVTQPDYIMRRISPGPFTPAVRDMEEWSRRNRLGSGIEGSIHHSYAHFVPEELFKDHPEYFAMKDTNGDDIGDVRTRGQPCTTHPEVIRMFLEGAVKRVGADPDLDLLPVSPNDGTPNMCRCERCRALGTYSDCAWTIAHQVAEAVRKAYPGRKVWIGFYAYGVVSRPPTVKAAADPDITVQVATAYNRVSVDKMFEEWPKYVGMIGVREYFAIPQWGANSPGVGITPHKARTVIPRYKASKATMLNAEGCPAWGGAGLGMYLAAQLMWDSSADPDKILEEFYNDCFSGAAEPMKRYFERWNRERLEPRTAKLALNDLREAMLKADTVGARRRVSLFALYIHSHQILARWKDINGENLLDDERVAFAGEAGAFRWRTRDFGMLRTTLSDESAYPTLPYYTYEEVLGLIEGDLAELKGVETAELQTRFGSTLAPVSEQAVGNQKVVDPWIPLESATLVMNLEKGKTVTLLVAGKGGQLEVRFAGPRPTGPIETKNLVLVADEEKVQFTATETGRHQLLVKAEGVRYQVVEPRYSAVMVKVEKNRTWFPIPTAGAIQYSFYVPIGAEAIYFGFDGKAGPGGIVELLDNQGTVVAKVERDADGKIQRESTLIHVPPGEDNQVWTVRTSATVGKGKIMLRGIPPYVSTDPAKLLVPQSAADVVEGGE